MAKSLLLLLLFTITIMSASSPPPPPPQQQLNNIIDALIGAGDFNSWTNMLSSEDPTAFPVWANFFIPSDSSEESSPAVDRMAMVMAYHIVPQRLSFSELCLWNPLTRLPTFIPTKSILITNDSISNFTLHDSILSHPHLYTTSTFVVHGIQTYGAADNHPFTPPPQQAQFTIGSESDAACLCLFWELKPNFNILEAHIISPLGPQDILPLTILFFHIHTSTLLPPSSFTNIQIFLDYSVYGSADNHPFTPPPPPQQAQFTIGSESDAACLCLFWELKVYAETWDDEKNVIPQSPPLPPPPPPPPAVAQSATWLVLTSPAAAAAAAAPPAAAPAPAPQPQPRRRLPSLPPPPPPAEITYRPQPGPGGVPKDFNIAAVVTVGSVGFQPFWRLWNAAGSDGRGVIGVLEAKFVEPAHDKQGSTYCHRIGYAPRRNKTVINASADRETSPDYNLWGHSRSKKNSLSGSRGGSQKSHIRSNQRSQGNDSESFPETENGGYRNGHVSGKGNDGMKILTKYRNGASPFEPSSSFVEDVGDDDMHVAPERVVNDSNRKKYSTETVFGKDGLHRTRPSSCLDDTESQQASGGSSARPFMQPQAKVAEASYRDSDSDLITVDQMKQEIHILKERLEKKEEELLGERDRCRSLEAQLQEAQHKIEELNKEQESLIDIFSEERDRQEREEENLRKKIKDASNTIQELVDKIKLLEKVK
ncbi:hypothetical protein Q3G72_029266 [Acer saccharum]|nr:hypothetical protein Q3G72_029266 [Acer saccharum]